MPKNHAPRKINIMTSLATTPGDVIRQARQQLQLNTRQFAAELGVSQNMVSLWERNVNAIDEARLNQWFADTREWVWKMAMELLVIKYRSLLAACRPVVSSH